MREKKMKMGDFKSKIDPKPALNKENERENLERKTKIGLFKREKLLSSII